MNCGIRGRVIAAAEQGQHGLARFDLGLHLRHTLLESCGSASVVTGSNRSGST